ncbi:MAG: ABC transporter permease [Phycisphaerae bacterium]|nr:ABC transporter permease [Phycisphaerae bacterium]
MRKTWAVAMREYRTNVRSKGFIVGVILMPVFMSGSVLVQTLVAKRGDASVKRVAVIDRTGSLFVPLHDAAEWRNKHDIFDSETGRQMEPSYEMVEIPPNEADRQGQLLELSDRVRSGELFAFVEINRGILDPREAAVAPAEPGMPSETTAASAAGSATAASIQPQSEGGAIRYYSNRETYRELPEWLSEVIGDRVRAARFARSGMDLETVMRALAPVRLDSFGLLSRSQTGEVKGGEATSAAAGFLVPFFVMMMMWMLLMIAVQPLLHGVLEEKMQRISEVLLGSLRPFDLMMGKLIGHAFVALTLLGIYAAGGIAVAAYYGKMDMVSPVLVGWFVFFLALAIFMYGSMFLAAGACCNDVKEAQSLIMPVMFPMIIPMFFLVPIIRDPGGGIATALSLFPLTSPMIMTMRQSMEVPVPLWQAPAALAGCALVTVICVWAAGRVFRVGILMQGKPPKMGQILSWAVRG